MWGVKSVGALILLFLANSILVTAQVDLLEGSQIKMLGMISRIADVDRSLKIDHYSLAQQRQTVVQPSSPS